MARTKITFKSSKTGKNKVGVLDIETNKVIVRGGNEYPLTKLDGVKHHETRVEGNIVQKVGKFLGLVK